MCVCVRACVCVCVLYVYTFVFYLCGCGCVWFVCIYLCCACFVCIYAYIYVFHVHMCRMSCPSDIFVDSFPSIVNLVCPNSENEEVVFSLTSKLFHSECGNSLCSMAICEKYCLVNKCAYSSGLAAVLECVQDLLSIESTRLPPILEAIHTYRLFYFTIDQPASKWNWKSLVGVRQKSGSFSTVLALLSFHRPGICLQIDESWFSAGLPTDSRSTMREVMLTIAATGEPKVVPLLAAALVVYAQDALETLCITTANFGQIWAICTQLGRMTPRTFSVDNGGNPLLSLCPSFPELVSPPSPTSPTATAERTSIAQDEEGISIVCAAGSHVEPFLPAFAADQNQQFDPIPEMKYIDARSEAERARDGAVFSTLATRDWYEQDGAQPTTAAMSFVRLKQSVWVEEDLDSDSLAFLFTKLEFHRGMRLCVFGVHKSRIIDQLLVREFPFVCVAQGGFSAICEEIVKSAKSWEQVQDVAILAQHSPVDTKITLPTPAQEFLTSGQKLLANWTQPRPTLLVSKRATPPMVDFEIGSSDDDHHLKSVDLSPVSPF